MKKKILALTLALCLIATTAFAGFGDSGAFGAIGNYLKRVGTSIVPAVTNTYNLGSSTKVWGTIYATAVSVVNWTVSGSWYWTGGRVHYLALGTDINAFIASASCVAGDTIQLASGTYTITSAITINKKLNIRGQGKGITTIACATDDVPMIVVSTIAGTMISDMTIKNTTAVTTSNTNMVEFQRSGVAENVEFLISQTGNSTRVSNAISTGSGSTARTIDIKNCSFSATGSTGIHRALIGGGTNSIINAKNCLFNESAGTYTGYGANLVYAGAAIINLYDCNFLTTSATASSPIMAESAAADIRIYGGSINASGAGSFDVMQISGAITLYDTTLVNGTTSGTITYAGTVVSSKVHADGVVTSTNFKKCGTFGALTIWISDGTTAEGALTGVEGDICLNGGTGAGQAAYCDAAGTNWTDM